MFIYPHNGWVGPVADLLLLRKSCSVGNRTRYLWVSSQELWPLDHRDTQFIFILEHMNIFRGLYMSTHVSPPVCRRDSITDSLTALSSGGCTWEKSWGHGEVYDVLEQPIMRHKGWWVHGSVKCPRCNLNANCREISVSSHGISFAIYDVASRRARWHHSTDNRVLLSISNSPQIYIATGARGASLWQ
jgi:hypothetical protein